MRKGVIKREVEQRQPFYFDGFCEEFGELVTVSPFKKSPRWEDPFTLVLNPVTNILIMFVS